ncbi:DUF7344 domain-containing protein [Halobacterium jilantaiense]|nr:hypothetical protein [Halobacterium jilantaiense]
MLEGTHETVDSGSQAEPATQSPDSPDTPNVDDSHEEEEEAEQTTELPLDVTFEVLKNKRRRLVLEYLRDTEETVTIGELAEHIAAIENDTTVKQLNAQQRKRVYIGLYQCHLPKMDDAGVVAFDQNRGRIEPGDNVDGLYDYLDVGEEMESESMNRVYLGSSLGFGVLFLGAQAAGAATLATALVVVFLAFALCLSGWQRLFEED